MLYANLLIGLREGLEATMVVTILAAYLTKTGRKHERPWLFGGVLAALIFTAISFAILHFGTKTLTTQGQELSLIHISEPTRQCCTSRMPSSA